jgi:hypothetical protein
MVIFSLIHLPTNLRSYCYQFWRLFRFQPTQSVLTRWSRWQWILCIQLFFYLGGYGCDDTSRLTSQEITERVENTNDMGEAHQRCTALTQSVEAACCSELVAQNLVQRSTFVIDALSHIADLTDFNFTCNNESDYPRSEQWRTTCIESISDLVMSKHSDEIQNTMPTLGQSCQQSIEEWQSTQVSLISHQRCILPKCIKDFEPYYEQVMICDTMEQLAQQWCTWSERWDQISPVSFLVQNQSWSIFPQKPSINTQGPLAQPAMNLNTQTLAVDALKPVGIAQIQWSTAWIRKLWSQATLMPILANNDWSSWRCELSQLDCTYNASHLIEKIIKQSLDQHPYLQIESIRTTSAQSAHGSDTMEVDDPISNQITTAASVEIKLARAQWAGLNLDFINAGWQIEMPRAPHINFKKSELSLISKHQDRYFGIDQRLSSSVIQGQHLNQFYMHWNVPSDTCQRLKSKYQHTHDLDLFVYDHGEAPFTLCVCAPYDPQDHSYATQAEELVLPSGTDSWTPFCIQDRANFEFLAAGPVLKEVLSDQLPPSLMSCDEEILNESALSHRWENNQEPNQEQTQVWFMVSQWLKRFACQNMIGSQKDDWIGLLWEVPIDWGYIQVKSSTDHWVIVSTITHAVLHIQNELQYTFDGTWLGQWVQRWEESMKMFTVRLTQTYGSNTPSNSIISQIPWSMWDLGQQKMRIYLQVKSQGDEIPIVNVRRIELSKATGDYLPPQLRVPPSNHTIACINSNNEHMLCQSTWLDFVQQAVSQFVHDHIQVSFLQWWHTQLQTQFITQLKQQSIREISALAQTVAQANLITPHQLAQRSAHSETTVNVNDTTTEAIDLNQSKMYPHAWGVSSLLCRLVGESDLLCPIIYALLGTQKLSSLKVGTHVQSLAYARTLKHDLFTWIDWQAPPLYHCHIESDIKNLPPSLNAFNPASSNPALNNPASNRTDAMYRDLQEPDLWQGEEDYLYGWQGQCALTWGLRSSQISPISEVSVIQSIDIQLQITQQTQDALNEVFTCTDQAHCDLGVVEDRSFAQGLYNLTSRIDLDVGQRADFAMCLVISDTWYRETQDPENSWYSLLSLIEDYGVDDQSDHQNLKVIRRLLHALPVADSMENSTSFDDSLLHDQLNRLKRCPEILDQLNILRTQHLLSTMPSVCHEDDDCQNPESGCLNSQCQQGQCISVRVPQSCASQWCDEVPHLDSDRLSVNINTLEFIETEDTVPIMEQEITSHIHQAATWQWYSIPPVLLDHASPFYENSVREVLLRNYRTQSALHDESTPTIPALYVEGFDAFQQSTHSVAFNSQGFVWPLSNTDAQNPASKVPLTFSHIESVHLLADLQGRLHLLWLTITTGNHSTLWHMPLSMDTLEPLQDPRALLFDVRNIKAQLRLTTLSLAYTRHVQDKTRLEWSHISLNASSDGQIETVRIVSDYLLDFALAQWHPRTFAQEITHSLNSNPTTSPISDYLIWSTEGGKVQMIPWHHPSAQIIDDFPLGVSMTVHQGELNVSQVGLLQNGDQFIALFRDEKLLRSRWINLKKRYWSAAYSIDQVDAFKAYWMYKPYALQVDYNSQVALPALLLQKKASEEQVPHLSQRLPYTLALGLLSDDGKLETQDRLSPLGIPTHDVSAAFMGYEWNEQIASPVIRWQVHQEEILYQSLPEFYCRIQPVP